MSAFAPRKLTFLMLDMRKFHFRAAHKQPIIRASVLLSASAAADFA